MARSSKAAAVISEENAAGEPPRIASVSVAARAEYIADFAGQLAVLAGPDLGAVRDHLLRAADAAKEAAT